MRERRTGRRAAAWLVLFTFGVSSAGCTTYRWRPVALSKLDARDREPPPRVRFTFDRGVVVLHLTAIDLPIASGRAEPGTGPVRLDLRTARRFRAAPLFHGGEPAAALEQPATRLALEAAALAGRTVEFETGSGAVTLAVREVLWPFAHGEPRGGQGIVSVDLDAARLVEVYRQDVANSALKTLGLVAGLTAGAFLLFALLKESCPFVYVDRGHGLELVGEAYAGAAFASIARDDLLPLPDVDGDRLMIRLRNEAHETQYTDRAELVVVDHEPGERILSTFDARLALVHGPQAPLEVRDVDGREATEQVARADERIWQTDLALRARQEAAPLREELVATFPAIDPGFRPVLEIVAGNTPWLDVVFSRFFAAMGDRLPRYLAAGNDPTAGSRIRGWREREGVDLRVEAMQGGHWRTVAVVPTVGPVALRRVAVPLPAVRGDIRVRLSSGFGFWRVDQLALTTEKRSVDGLHVRPERADGPDGADERSTVVAVDGRYQVLERLDSRLDLYFTLPAQAPGRARSLFLLSTGYYNVHPPPGGRWSPGVLRAIRSEPGAFSRFSRDLARDSLRRAARGALLDASGGEGTHP